jgi:hypothetical protein
LQDNGTSSSVSQRWADAELRILLCKRETRSWLRWLAVLLVAMASLLLSQVELLPSILRLILLVSGALFAFIFLAFLSSKQFGRGDGQG